ncbi:MAG: zinc ribbon domain-containing protein [Candidatus Bathyarchaeota archaeon]|nr:MAG: zinc ribbon domain-containing protein [Candidatus Bathyarchaeota archaeon]
MSISVGVLFPLPTIERGITCPRCGRNIPSSYRFCGCCGVDTIQYLAWQKATRPCQKCKRTIPFLATFCPECGTKQV